eukprot:scaffold4150_cov117-Cylindrotheca_fusiformis.AAC.7
MASNRVEEATTSAVFLFSLHGEAVPRDVQHVRLDTSVRDLPDSSFESHSGLQTVELPLTLSRIGKLAFCCCNNLTTINFPSCIREIPEDAFRSCCSLTNLDLPSMLETIGGTAFYECRSLTRIECPPHLKKIGKATFMQCSSMVSIDLPKGLKDLGDRAFARCVALESITIPSGITMIKKRTFVDCRSLQTVKFAKTGLQVVGYGAFWSCRSLESVCIPSTVRRLGQCAFSGCRNLISVELYHGLQIIEQQAFQSCTSLVNIALPSSLQSISENTFEECDKLRSLLPHHDPLTKKLRRRFHGLPIHRLCYELRGEAETKSTVLQKLVAPDALPTQVDCFGMTVFHILCVSKRESFDLLLKLCQLVSAKVTLVDETDAWGNCPMDYLCRKKDRAAIASIRNIIKVTTQRRVEQLGLTEWQVAVSSDCQNLIDSDNGLTRRQRIHAFYLKLLRYERLETLSLLELALWSQKMDDAKSVSDVAADLYRSECRINCGSDIVISHVLPFLGGLEAGMSFRIASP